MGAFKFVSKLFDIMHLKHIIDVLTRSPYKPTKGRLYRVIGDELRACALGQLALADGIISEEDARKIAKTGSHLESPIYDKLRKKYGPTLIAYIPSVNDSRKNRVASPNFFSSLIEMLTKAIDTGKLEKPS